MEEADAGVRSDRVERIERGHSGPSLLEAHAPRGAIRLCQRLRPALDPAGTWRDLFGYGRPDEEELGTVRNGAVLLVLRVRSFHLHGRGREPTRTSFHQEVIG